VVPMLCPDHQIGDHRHSPSCGGRRLRPLNCVCCQRVNVIPR
jgi:hypothetical protein